MLRGEYISSNNGRLFCVVRGPAQRPCPAIIVVPAFGDEMNKTRRMITELAKALERHGVAVLIPDLFGTGDSEAEFINATWNGWLEDLDHIYSWAQKHGLTVVGLVAIRTGALLAAQFSQALPNPLLMSVLWQPVRSGAAFFRQILRMRTVSNAVNAGKRETVDQLIAMISRGEPVLVGGYWLTSAHVVGPSAIELQSLNCRGLGALRVIEVTSAVEKLGAFTETFGSVAAEGYRFVGAPYWSSTETVCNHDVVAQTTRWLCKRAQPHAA